MRAGADRWRATNLGDRLRLRSLLRVVGSDTLGLDALGLRILLVVGAEEVDLIVVLLRGRSSSRAAEEGLAGGAGTGQGGELGLVGLDVSVPAGDGGGRLRVGSGGDRLEDDDVGLGRDVAGEEAISAVISNRLDCTKSSEG